MSVALNIEPDIKTAQRLSAGDIIRNSLSFDAAELSRPRVRSNLAE